jgi:hypothetical protein
LQGKPKGRRPLRDLHTLSHAGVTLLSKRRKDTGINANINIPIIWTKF